MGYSIQITSRDGEPLSALGEASGEYAFEGMSFESVCNGGFTVATFTVHRDARDYWKDLIFGNPVKIVRGASTDWEGRIDAVSRGVKPDAIEVQCLGNASILHIIFYREDIIVGAPYKLSDFINDDLFPNTNIPFVRGTIDTNDYAYTAGARFEFKPATSYYDVIKRLNEGNGYNWGVWNNSEFSFIPPETVRQQWVVQIEDCSSLTISDNVDALCNHILLDYTPDDSHHLMVEIEDTASIAKYGRVSRQVGVPGKCAPDDAEEIAGIYLDECKDLQVSADYTCTRVYDVNGNEHHLAEVRGGDQIYLQGWLATQRELYRVDNITTYNVLQTTYHNDTYELDVVPNAFLPSTEIYLARANIVGYL